MQGDSTERRIALARGNEAKLEEIMGAYGSHVKRLIYSYVKDWGIAGDLAQDVFVAVFMKLESFEGRSSYKTWVYTIAVNRSKDYLKSWHYRHMAVAEKVFSLMKDLKRTPEETAIEKDGNRQLLEAVWSLPLKYREVILLHFYQDLTVSEISETLGLPLATVKTRLLRAKEKIRNAYIPLERGGRYGSV
ncbi:RNA polymerase factor sigma C [Neobacillus piezotolerans]|uniref:RNA polymerase factor sigma C n=1 Tax=Neobacillus piezotolerans TaxID=2259171 RepID=A0A3D8GQW3_9BACI|nr:sigma-70 family RNA polymerase sigma factor [Neobacillus piezotolerans]RDU36884.1 RNA polymerase factor sigma C [Neobacillus piezotolerans]